MQARFLAAALAVICTLLSTNLLARPSLSSIDAKLDQLLAGQQAILEDIERLRRQLGITLPFCEDLEFSGTIWGQEARGVDLRQYTNSTLHFIGCNGNGCPADSFFCTVDRANLVLTFGTTSNVALRALSDPDDGLVVGASTDRSAASLELLELDLRSGPCLACYETGAPVHAILSSDTSRKRWPEFARQARANGIESVVALPLKLRGTAVGALNLFLTDATDMPDKDKRAAQSLADVASIGILNARALSESQIVQDQLQHALDSRVVIEQAKGMVSQDLEIDDAAAFDLIRSYSRNNNRKLRSVSEQITNRELLPGELANTGDS